MAKNLGEFKIPIGGSGSIFSPMSWLQGILGVVFLVFVVNIGMSVAKKIDSKIPADLSSGGLTGATAPATSETIIPVY